MGVQRQACGSLVPTWQEAGFGFETAELHSQAAQSMAIEAGVALHLLSAGKQNEQA